MEMIKIEKNWENIVFWIVIIVLIFIFVYSLVTGKGFE